MTNQVFRRRGAVKVSFLSALIAGVGLAFGSFALLSHSNGAPSAPVAPVEKPPIVEKAVASANTLSEAFRTSSARVMPAVVAIQHTSEAKAVQFRGGPRGNRGGEGQVPDELQPFLKKFFGDQLPDMDQMPSQPSQSSGSGVIIDPKGIVLTNNHVVAGGGKVTVRLHDGRVYQAEKVMTDPGTDLAVVKLANAHDLPAATLGNSDEMQVGDWVLALGQPFGLQDTVTQGIISATNRGVGITKHEEFLQTDAAINPGNSGGPLVNLRGDVIGINTAISSTSGGYQGIGFAIPVNVVKWVVPQLLKDGTVHRAFLGVGIQEVDQALAEQLGMDRPTGALVTDVQAGSPAATAGMKSEDVIVEFAGTKISNPRHLQAVVSRSALGSDQPLKVLRDGKTMSLTVKVKERPESFGEHASAPVEHGEVHGQAVKSLGLEVATLTKDIAKTLGVEQTEGVVIVSVTDEGPAAKAGLQATQVITQVGRTKVKTVEEFTAAMKNVSLEKGVLLLVRSGEGSRFVVVKE